MARKRKKRRKLAKPTKAKRRNPYALIAAWRSGSGRHPNKRNVQRKKACRGKVKTEGE